MSLLSTDDHEARELKNRFQVVFLVVMAVFALLLFRLWYLQVIQGDRFRNLSESNRVRVRVVTAPRGIIHDVKGRILVDNRPAFDVYLVPEDVPNLPEALERVGRLLGLSDEELADRLRRARGQPPWRPLLVKGDVSRDDVALVETRKLDLPGVFIEVGQRRAYRYGRLAAHLLGYMGEISDAELKRPEYREYRQGEFIGKVGVERRYERYLRGVHGQKHIEVDAAGREVAFLREVPAIPGKDLYLTIDLDLQLVAEEAMKDRAGAVIALDPRTGDVLAMVSAPAFDPDVFARGITPAQWQALVQDPRKPLNNKGIQGTYPPGSTFKTIMAAAGLDSRAIAPHTAVDCPGSFAFGRRLFRDWKPQGHGAVTLYDSLVQSCDVYYYKLADRLGIDRIAEQAAAMGLGRPTGIELEGEKAGVVPSTRWKLERLKQPWYPGETISVGIGQGYVTVTPIQLVAAYAALGNGGRLVRPQVVRRVVDLDGTVIRERRPEVTGVVPLAPEARAAIVRALLGVVEDPRGTAYGQRLKGIRMAGKTGTAQVGRLYTIKEEAQIPWFLRDHAWFVAISPEEEAEIAVVALVEHGGHGSSAAAPVVRRVIERYWQLKRETEQAALPSPPVPAAPARPTSPAGGRG
ncbi:MAG TPA: penicillin-binding protein 2 [Thermodesulfobacteriota bacterium]|nr:penicillin-binding protein 2 [Thermodesulfobacteriota bacterium]